MPFLFYISQFLVCIDSTVFNILSIAELSSPLPVNELIKSKDCLLSWTGFLVGQWFPW